MSKLSDYVINLESGGRDKGGAIKEGIPSLGAEHLNSKGGFDLNSKKLKFISKKYFLSMKTGIIKHNDIIIVKDGATTGKVSFVTSDFPFEKAAINEHLFILRADNRLYPKYLFYFLLSDDGKRKILNDFRGSTIGGISRNFINMEIFIPPIKEQIEIARILDILKDLISLRENQIEKFNILIKSRFVEMFGDPVTNSMNLQKGKIRDIVREVKYGTSRPSLNDGKYKYIRMNNITYNGELDLSELKYIDIPENEIEKCIVQKGDLLFNRTNSKELVGKTCVFNQDESMIIAGYIIRVRMNDKALPEYLCAVLNSRYGKETLLRMCKAIVGQANINAQELQDIQILIPPIELQYEFVKFREQVDKLKVEVQKNLNELTTLYNALMQKYFG